jgi:hypothetical protein
MVMKVMAGTAAMRTRMADREARAGRTIRAGLNSILAGRTTRAAVLRSILAVGVIPAAVDLAAAAEIMAAAEELHHLLHRQRLLLRAVAHINKWG